MDRLHILRRWVLPALLTASTAALAQEVYPSRPLRFVVPFGAGGSADIVSRLLAESLQADLGQTVFVDNRPGAGGTLGNAVVAQSRPDGHTFILVGPPNFSVSPALYGPKVAGNVPSDFMPVAMFASFPNVVLAGEKFPGSSLKDLVGYAKQQRDKIFVSTGALGSTGHLAAALLANRAGFEWTYVPDKAPLGPLLADAVQASVYTLPAALPLIRSGKLKGLAVTSLRRTASAPDIPTVAEAGYPGFEAVAWYGIAFPAGTPAHIVAALEKATRAATQKPALRERIEQLGGDVVYMAGKEFDQFTRKDREKAAELVKLTGVKVE